MDFLDLLLGRDSRGNDITGAISTVSRLVVGCGCVLILMVLAGIALVVGGVFTFGESAINVIVVFIMIIVAVVSLIRSSLGR